MTKHTPGPWEWRGDFNYTNGGFRIVIGPDGQICQVTPVADRKRSTLYDAADPERDANAALIAAAPDLLATLKALVESGTDSPEHRAAEAAIAKAEGRT